MAADSSASVGCWRMKAWRSIFDLTRAAGRALWQRGMRRQTRSEKKSMTGHIDPTKEVFTQFRDNDREGPIHMLNLVRLLDRAVYPDGRSATGAEAYAAYGRDSGPVFTRLGGRIVWQGSFELMLIGPA